MTDKEIIVALGGVSALARRLGYIGYGGIRRVSNWTRRGIPSLVKLENPNIFAKVAKAKKASND